MVRKVLLRLSAFGLVSGAILYAGQAERLLKPTTPASVGGRVTVLETINRKPVTNPVRDLDVFLFTMEASKPFQDLQHKCRRAMAQPNADPVQTYKLCDKCLAEAFELVARLPATATARTGRDGSFRFENVEPGRSYHVVGIKPAEGGSPIVVVGTTARLRPHELVLLDLSENDPWTGPLELK